MPTPILVFAGSTRTGSLNGRLAALCVRELAALGAAPTALSLADHAMPIYDGDAETASGPPEAAVRLAETMTRHAGIVVAHPEYNAGMTPLLKNALDWVSRVKQPSGAPSPFKGRLFGLVSASPGGYGGYRGLMMARQVLELGLGAQVLPSMVAVPRAQQAFTEAGDLADQGLAQALRAMLGHFVSEAKRFAPKD